MRGHPAFSAGLLRQPERVTRSGAVAQWRSGAVAQWRSGAVAHLRLKLSSRDTRRGGVAEPSRSHPTSESEKL